MSSSSSLGAPADMRVAMVSAFFPAHGGGIEAVAEQLAFSISRRGFEVCWVAGGPVSEAPSDPGSDCLEITHAPSFDFLESKLGLPFPVWGFRGLVDLWRAVRRSDVVHVHDYLYLPSLFSILFAKILRKPLVITQHVGSIPFRSAIARTTLEVLNRTVGRFALRAADQVVFVGKPVQAYFSRLFRLGTDSLLIPNGVDHERYRPVASEAPKAGPVKLLFVGRFVEKKGIALIRTSLDIPGTTWTFVGWGPLTPASWPELPESARVFERCSAADIVPLYQEADLLVLPSTGEGFPLVIQEALACGTPVLVSKEVEEAFPASDDCCVYDVELRAGNSAQALRACITALAADRTALQSARGAAARLAWQWSWDACAESYLDLYLRLGGKQERSSRRVN